MRSVVHCRAAQQLAELQCICRWAGTDNAALLQKMHEELVAAHDQFTVALAKAVRVGVMIIHVLQPSGSVAYCMLL